VADAAAGRTTICRPDGFLSRPVRNRCLANLATRVRRAPAAEAAAMPRARAGVDGDGDAAEAAVGGETTTARFLRQRVRKVLRHGKRLTIATMSREMLSGKARGNGESPAAAAVRKSPDPVAGPPRASRAEMPAESDLPKATIPPGPAKQTATDHWLSSTT
jgi:hypothetical protein